MNEYREIARLVYWFGVPAIIFLVGYQAGLIDGTRIAAGKES